MGAFLTSFAGKKEEELLNNRYFILCFPFNNTKNYSCDIITGCEFLVGYWKESEML